MAKWKNALLISTIVAPAALGAGPIGSALADAVNSIGTKPTKTDVTITKMLNTQSKQDNYYWGNGLSLSENGDTTSFATADGWKKAGADYEFTAFRLPTNVIKGQPYLTGDKPTVSNAYIVDDATIYAGDGTNHFGSYDEATDTYTVDAEDRDDYAAATGTPYASIATMKWSQAIGVEEPAAQADGGPINAAGTAKSAYTFELTLNGATEISEFQDYLGNDAANKGNMGTGDDTTKPGYQLKTGDDSTLTFQDLADDEWVIFETNNPSGSSKVEMAVPMVLNLPMVQPDGKAWFGNTTDGTKAINLYPKDFILNGDLTVHKQDVNDAPVAGADFILIDGLAAGAADGIADVAAAITAGTKYNVGTVDNPVEKTIVEMDTAETIALLTKSVANGGFGLTIVDPDGVDGGNKYVTTAAGTGEATFTNIKPDYTYYTMETNTPEGYDEIGTIQQIQTTTDVKDEYDVNEDGKVYFTGGKYSVRNLPTTIIDKKIAVDSQMDTNSNTPSSSTDMQIFQDNDFVTGVSRGEHFQYKVDAAFDKYLTGNVQPGDNTLANQNGYNKFVIDDTFDPAIDITSFQIGTTVNGVYTPLYLVDLTVDGKDQSVDGGFSGAGGSYGATIYDLTQPKVDDKYVDVSSELAPYITITGTAAQYSNPNSQTITGTPGNLQVSLTPAVNGASDTIEDFSGNTVAQKFVSMLTQSGTSYSTGSVTLVMNAQTNSAAAVGQLNNNAKLTSQTVNGTPHTPSDDSKTFNAGWEFVKTDADSEALEGAGFDLSRKLASGEQLTQKDRLLNEASGIMNLRNEGGDLTDAAITALAKLAAQFGTETDWYLGANGGTQDEQDLHTALVTYLGLSADDQKVVANQTPVAEAMVDVLNGQLALIQAGRATDLYFAHLDENGLPVVSMTMTKEMGDVLWTPYKTLATTHFTNDQGYFQYCGLAMGPYTLTETVVPSGFDKVADIDFFIGDQDLMAGITVTNNQIDLTTNPYTASDEKTKEKSAAWIKTATAFNNANSGATKFGLLNDKWSDDAITGTDDTDNLVDLAEEGKVVQIKNYEKSIFPLVGGLGTLFAVIAGLLAMGLALLKRKKDMKNEA